MSSTGASAQTNGFQEPPKVPPARPSPAASGFEEFRRRYPATRRDFKVELACRAYIGRIHGTLGEHEKLMAGLSRYLASVQWQRSLSDALDGRFIPAMEKFIVDGLYLDSPPPANPEPENGGYLSYDQAVQRTKSEALLGEPSW